MGRQTELARQIDGTERSRVRGADQSVLSAALGVQTALDAGGAFRSVVPVAAGGLLVVIAMRWLYFGQPTEEVVLGARRAGHPATRPALTWGYGH